MTVTLGHLIWVTSFGSPRSPHSDKTQTKFRNKKNDLLRRAFAQNTVKINGCGDE